MGDSPTPVDDSQRTRLGRQLAKALLSLAYRSGVTYLRTRRHFPLLLNARGLLGEAAEIGVAHGHYSELLLESWKGRRLYSIDAWHEFPQEQYRDVTNLRQEGQEQAYAATLARLARFGERSQVLRMTSAEAAQRFEDHQLDFVYLDAQHHYKAIREDLDLWHPKLRSGGILAGHDYLDGNLPEGSFGVKAAVDEFARDHRLSLYVSAEPQFPSWFLLIGRER